MKKATHHKERSSKSSSKAVRTKNHASKAKHGGSTRTRGGIRA